MGAYDVFICYRRDGGEALSQLLYERLTRDGLRVFYDVETMRSGKFNEQILRTIPQCGVIVLVLPPGSLDRCGDPEDWVRQELECAMAHGKVIIPVMMRGFSWPAALPEKLQELPNWQGIAANDFSVFDTWYARLRSYIADVTGASGPAQPQPPEDQAWFVRFCLQNGNFAEADEALDELLQEDPKNAELWLLKALSAEKLTQEEELAQLTHALDENKAFMSALRYADAAMRARLMGYYDAVKQVVEDEKRARLAARRQQDAAHRQQAEAAHRNQEEAARRRPPDRLSAGACVTFGIYPQAADGTDQTPIEWLVLEVRDGKALLLSRYGLDAKPYNTEYEDITWEKCSLRAWLNGDFFKEAFTAAEQKAILMTAVDNSRSQEYSKWRTEGGSSMQDRIFLLSYAEVSKYFCVAYDYRNNTESRAAPTAYAIRQGAFASAEFRTADSKAAGWWWLRSPGYLQRSAADVHPSGSLAFNFINRADGSVRPAMWVNLEAGIFRT